jgi:hypothetical protein
VPNPTAHSTSTTFPSSKGPGISHSVRLQQRLREAPTTRTPPPPPAGGGIAHSPLCTVSYPSETLAWQLTPVDRGLRQSLRGRFSLGHAKVLIGQREGSWFDGKSAPYQLTTEEQKWELAKDVGAFANSETGSLIVVGAKTQSSAARA